MVTRTTGASVRMAKSLSSVALRMHEVFRHSLRFAQDSLSEQSADQHIAQIGLDRALRLF